MTRALVALLALSVGAAPVPPRAIFIHIDGIVADGDRDGGIEVLTFAIGRENVADCREASAAAGSRLHADVQITRATDKASPLLAQVAERGESFAEVKVEFGDRGPSCALTFSEVKELRVVQRGGRESISFSYARLDFQPID